MDYTWIEYSIVWNGSKWNERIIWCCVPYNGIDWERNHWIWYVNGNQGMYYWKNSYIDSTSTEWNLVMEVIVLCSGTLYESNADQVHWITRDYLISSPLNRGQSPDSDQVHFSMEWNSLSLKSATQSSLMGFTKRLLLLNGMQLYIGFTITWNGIHLY